MLAIIIAVVTVIIDQVTKYWAVAQLGDGDKIEIIKGIFSFTYTRNYGAAFGMLQNQRWFFLIITIPAIALISYLIWKEKPGKLAVASLALILGGAIGNLIDRVALSYVRDFIYVEAINFPIFNVADAAVTVGAALLIGAFLFKKEPIFEFKAKPKIKEIVENTADEEEINE